MRGGRRRLKGQCAAVAPLCTVQYNTKLVLLSTA